MCNQYYYFAEKRFRFFVEWDPNALTQTDIDGLPLYDVIASPIIQGFQMTFEAGIKYFPTKKGITLLFRKSNYNSTPFVKACIHFGEEQVMKMIEDTLAHCYASSDNTPPLNIAEALTTASIGKDIHDCFDIENVYQFYF